MNNKITFSTFILFVQQNSTYMYIFEWTNNSTILRVITFKSHEYPAVNLDIYLYDMHSNFTLIS